MQLLLTCVTNILSQIVILTLNLDMKYFYVVPLQTFILCLTYAVNFVFLLEFLGYVVCF